MVSGKTPERGVVIHILCMLTIFYVEMTNQRYGFPLETPLYNEHPLYQLPNKTLCNIIMFNKDQDWLHWPETIRTIIRGNPIIYRRFLHKSPGKAINWVLASDTSIALAKTPTMIPTMKPTAVSFNRKVSSPMWLIWNNQTRHETTIWLEN